jgi:hypothetical protein
MSLRGVRNSLRAVGLIVFVTQAIEVELTLLQSSAEEPTQWSAESTRAACLAPLPPTTVVGTNSLLEETPMGPY